MKTLKDLTEYMISNGNPNDWSILKSDLRQSAIEWIKELENESSYRLINDTFICGQDCDPNHCCDDGVVNFIKHFFNITEDDLK